MEIEQLNNTLAVRDIAISAALAAIIRHHPKREAVLTDLRQAHVRFPLLLSPEAGQAIQNYLGMVREMERQFSLPPSG